MNSSAETQGHKGGGAERAAFALWRKLPKRRKVQVLGLLCLSLLASALEVLSLGMLFPLLALLAAPPDQSSGLLDPILALLQTRDREVAVGLTLLAFAAAAVFAGGVRLAVLYANNRFSYAVASELAERVYRGLLYKPYVAHLSHNTSTLIDVTLNKTLHAATGVLSAALSLVTAVLVGSGILLAILVADPVVALAAAVLFGCIYWALSAYSRRHLRRNSEIISRQSVRAIRAIQEGFGGIRDVIIDGTQPTYLETFRRADRPAKAALAQNVVIGGAPRFVVETIGMIFIALLAFFLSRRGDGLAEAIPTLGILALGAQRLLPLMQQGYSSLSSIRGSEAALWELLEHLDEPVINEVGERLRFRQEIRLDDVSFRYPSSEDDVLRNVTLTIAKGMRIGFFGASGGGKSTTLDIIMGLLLPSGGSLRVDGVVVDAARQPAWRKNIAHVPQAIFLADTSIAENIAFGGGGQLDMERVQKAARLAQLHETIARWPAGYGTIVGERGVRLSGGQRQRIGIARALYKQSELIILDEATSALDNDTEAALIAALEQLEGEVTVIMVAHRLTTLRNCDMVVEMVAGHVTRSGSYAELIGA